MIAQAIVAALTTMPGVVLPRINDIAVGWRALVAIAVASIGASIGVAVIPFLVHRRLHDTASLKTGHETAGRLESRVRSVMVAAQTGLAFVLIAAATLLGVSLQRLLATPSGFDAGVVTMRVSVPAASYPTLDTTARFFNGFVDELAGQGGVQKAGFVSTLPLTGSSGSTLTVQGREDIPMAERPEVGWQWASPGYFDAMGIPLVKGRGFTNADLAEPGARDVDQRDARAPAFRRMKIRSASAFTSAAFRRRACRNGTRSSAWSATYGTAASKPSPTRAPTTCSASIGAATISLAVRTTAATPAAATTVRSVLARHDPRAGRVRGPLN